MAKLEKILNDILNNMDEDDKKEVDTKSVHNHGLSQNQTNGKYNNNYLHENGFFASGLTNGANDYPTENKLHLNGGIKNEIFSKNNEKQSVGDSLDFILKDAVIKWVESPKGQAVINNILTKIIENKINIPVEYIKDTLNQRLSDEAIADIIKKIIKSNL